MLAVIQPLLTRIISLLLFLLFIHLDRCFLMLMMTVNFIFRFHLPVQQLGSWHIAWFIRIEAFAFLLYIPCQLKYIPAPRGYLPDDKRGDSSQQGTNRKLFLWRLGCIPGRPQMYLKCSEYTKATHSYLTRCSGIEAAILGP